MNPRLISLLYRWVTRGAEAPGTDTVAADASVTIIDSFGAPLTVERSMVPMVLAAELGTHVYAHPTGPYWVLDPAGMRMACVIAIESGDPDMALLTMLANTSWTKVDDGTDDEMSAVT